MRFVTHTIHILLLVGLLALGWQAVAFGLAVTIRRHSPMLAARYAPGNALVLGSLAQQQLTDDVVAAQESARRALRRDPTSAIAASTLSIAFAKQGDTARSTAMLAYAEQLSRRDLTTQLFAIEAAVQRGDILNALRHYDIALRVGKSMPPLLFPVLDSASVDTAIRAPLARMLARGTPWQSSFLDYLSANTKDIGAAARLVDAIYVAGGSVPYGPMSVLIQRLLEAGDVPSAWRLYRYKNPKAQRASLRNGDFSAAPDLPTLFDWRLEDDGDARAEILRSNRGGELRIEARAGAGGTVASQRLVLSPGRYALAFTVRAGENASFGASVFEITCVPSRQRIGLVRIDGAAKGQQILRFVVPSDCLSQSLDLTIKPGNMEEDVEGAIDDVVLTSIAPVSALQ